MLKILGCKRTPTLENSILAISKFVRRDLRILSSVKISIKVTTAVPEFKAGTSVAFHYNTGPHEHEIFLSRNAIVSYQLLVRCIAHEMRHVAQIERGRLKTYVRHNRSFFQYDGVSMALDTTDYWNSPWEVDAMKYEGTILRKMGLNHA